MHDGSAFAPASFCIRCAPQKKHDACRVQPSMARRARTVKQRLPSDVPPARKMRNMREQLIKLAKVRGMDTRTAARELDALRAQVNERVPLPSTTNELMDILNAAGFSHLGAPAPLKLVPPPARALALRVRHSSSLRNLPNTINVIHPPSLPPAPWKPSETPGAFHVAVRGTTAKRATGLLLTAKLRALESAYNAPLDLLRTRAFAMVRRVTNTLSQISTNGDTSDSRDGAQRAPSAHVPRAVPAGDPLDLLRAAGTLEPAYEDVIVVYAPQRAKRKRLQDALVWAERAVQRAVDPVSGPVDDEEEEPSLGALRIELYRDVPWGELHHHFPAEAQAVLPRTRDLLRVDALTLVGLASAFLTYFRDAQSPFVGVALAGTVLVYGTRIGIGLQGALSIYRERIAAQKFSRVVAKDEAAVQAVVEMRRDCEFERVAAEWAACAFEVRTNAPGLAREAV